ncbi:BTAD domain-containing putative transcriptional regulator [Streptomyces sp. NPDC005500]|uniref:BTAD domain-containing putative transcriptional regulator n=1 Tax=Streptomyces sp. NPDC005500 TaxID=3155007 RepID=UPI0033B9BE6B
MPSRRQRALLVRLLLDPGRVVSADALVDSAWDADDQPIEPRGALQTQISRLRTGLQEAGAVLETSPPGYRLNVTPQFVDASVFERLLSGARDLVDTVPETALEQYNQALGMWRGHAYAEFAESFARPEAIRLEQLRLSATEDRIRLLLLLGETGLAVAEADALTTAEPLREGAHALLMRALAEAGRQGEALAVYQRIHKRLVDELGTEPTEDLQALHVRILRQEDTQPAEGARTPGPRSDQNLTPVPSTLSSFIGRENEMQAVVSALAAARVVSIVGTGGVGKSRLAIECAPHLPGAARVWVELAALRDPADVPQAFLDALGLSNPSGDPPLEILVTALRMRDIVLIVDNCEHVVDEVAATISTVIRTCPGVRVIATSRERLAIDGEHVVRLEPLPLTNGNGGTGEAPAVRLFLDRLGEAGYMADQRDPAIQRLAHLVSRRLDGLPLALELTAAHASALGLDYVAETANLFDLGTGRRTEQESHQSLRAVLAWSYNLLTSDEQRLLRRLAVFPGWFPASWCEAVCADEALPAGRIGALLAALVEKSLVVRLPRPAAGGRSHGLLETVKSFAKEELTAREMQELRRAHARFTVAWTETTARTIGSSDDKELSLIAAAVHDLRAARAWAHENDTDLAVRLSAALHRYASELRGDFEMLSWAEAATELPGFTERPLYRIVLASAVTAAIMRGDSETAARRAAEAVAALPVSDPQASIAYGSLVHAAGVTGDFGEEIRANRRAWQASRIAQDPVGETLAATWLAIDLNSQGNHEGAQRWLVRSQAAADRSPSLIPHAIFLAAHGWCSYDEAYEKATASLMRMREDALSIGAPFVAGYALLYWVALEGQRPENVQDLDVFRQALTSWQNVGNRTGIGTVLLNLIPVMTWRQQDEVSVALYTTVNNSGRFLPGLTPDPDTVDHAVAVSTKRLGMEAESTSQRWKDAGMDSALQMALDAIDREKP